MEFHVITLFPYFFEAFLETSIVKIARKKGIFRVHIHNLRAYTQDKHGKVDGPPYGGGPGMVLSPEPIFQAVEAICPEVQDKEFKSQKETALILLTPQGQRYHQKKAMELAQKKKLVFICGRYEGFDERVRLGLPVEEISIGDYVLSGGEIPAMVILDSVIRLLPGALGDHESTKQESFTTHLLDFPQYTRPPEFRGMKVPQVLLSGNHGEIEKWRNLEAYKRTKERRKDLLLEE